MKGSIARALAAVVATGALAAPALAQKSGGTLRVQHRDNAPSASIHEESTVSVNMPFMGVYNNLVLYDQTRLPAISRG